MEKLKQLYRFLSPRYQNLFLEYKVNVKPRFGMGSIPPHPELYDIINSQRDTYRDYLLKSLNYRETLWKIRYEAEERNSRELVWNNGYLPGLDIIGLYTMLAEIQPATYLEVGSGNSTMVAAKAIRENKLETKIISIDPVPRSSIDELADTVIRKPFESIDFDIVNNLNKGDILFIDNSHRIFPNSDSMVFFLEVLPRLKKGVYVHLHDIYLPYDYPQFMCDRFYSEQYGLAMYILANPEKYLTILPNYFIFKDRELSEIIVPLWENEQMSRVEKHGGSYWLQVQ